MYNTIVILADKCANIQIVKVGTMCYTLGEIIHQIKTRLHKVLWNCFLLHQMINMNSKVPNRKLHWTIISFLLMYGHTFSWTDIHNDFTLISFSGLLVVALISCWFHPRLELFKSKDHGDSLNSITLPHTGQLSLLSIHSYMQPKWKWWEHFVIIFGFSSVYSSRHVGQTSSSSEE